MRGSEGPGSSYPHVVLLLVQWGVWHSHICIRQEEKKILALNPNARSRDLNWEFICLLYQQTNSRIKSFLGFVHEFSINDSLKDTLWLGHFPLSVSHTQTSKQVSVNLPQKTLFCIVGLTLPLRKDKFHIFWAEQNSKCIESTVPKWLHILRMISSPSAQRGTILLGRSQGMP